MPKKRLCSGGFSPESRIMQSLRGAGRVTTGRTPIMGHAKELSGLGFNRYQSQVLRNRVGWVSTGINPMSG